MRIDAAPRGADDAAMNTNPYLLSAEEKRVIEFEARGTAASGASLAIFKKISDPMGGGLTQEIQARERWLAELRRGDPRRDSVEREITRLKAVREEWKIHYAVAKQRAEPLMQAASNIRELFDRMNSTSKHEGAANG